MYMLHIYRNLQAVGNTRDALRIYRDLYIGCMQHSGRAYRDV